MSSEISELTVTDEKVLEIIEETLEIDRFDLDPSKLFKEDLGASDSDLILVINALEDSGEFGNIKFIDVEIFSIQCIGDLLRLVEEKAKK